MINITEEQRIKLKNHVKNLDQLIEGDDINELLFAIDDAIVYHIGDDDEPDATGIEIQRIYDEIFDQN